MKKKILSLIAGAVLLGGFSANSHAALYTVDEESDLFFVGDFIVAGNNQASGTGQNYEVLKFAPRGVETTATASDGSLLDQAPHGDITVGQLWTHLNNNGLASAPVLAFGFDANQVTNFVDITALQISFGAENFTLGDNSVRVVEHHIPGSSLSEAIFQINLGSDFMTTYNGASAEDFFIQATVDNANGGFEEWFLSSIFTSNPPGPGPGPGPTPSIPEPATMLTIGLGLAAGGFAKKKKLIG